MRALLLLTGLLSFVAPLQAATPPNVVLIISDDQGWKDYSFMGHPQIRTPHLDKLASRSLVYTRGYVPDSLCRPSLATMLSGQYPNRHKITGNDPALTGEFASMTRAAAMKTPAYSQLRVRYSQQIDSLAKLPAVLNSQKGYVSLQTGKWWERNFVDGGFTHGMSHGKTGEGGRHGDEGLAVGRQGIKAVEEFIDGAVKDQKPFFVWYAPMLPHTPHNPPQRLLEKYKDKTPHLPQAKYWAMCDWFDETCGELLGAIDKRGLTDNTIVLYVTDNGWVQTDSGEGGAFGGARGKRSQYDGGVRTPIMVSWHGHVAPRRDDTHLAHSIDLFPTILAATGIEDAQLRASLPGKNLMSDEEVASRTRVFGDIYEHDVKEIGVPATSLRWRWVIDGEWKLIEPHRSVVSDGVTELYHVTADPDEAKNLAEAEPERVKALRQSLDAWWKPE